MFFDERDPLSVDRPESQRADFDARFVKRLCQDPAHRIGTVGQRGKETIPLRWDGTLQPRQQESQNGREGESAATGKEIRLETGRFKKFL